MKKFFSVGGLMAAALAWSSGGRAAGFDTPILYSARHQAMGGTAIGYVSDPSATFHNPAGLAAVRRFSLLGDLSLLLGKVRASPERGVSSIESETVVAPFFMLAGAARLQDYVVLGLGVFPVASGGARYEYQLAGNRFVDSTNIVFVEVTPNISLQLPPSRALPGRLSLGIGYRASVLLFNREKGAPDNPRVLNLDMTGANFSGVRIGLQYRPVPSFGVGFVFRNRIEVAARADESSVFVQTATDTRLPFVLPAKVGAGMSFDTQALRLACDAEYAFQDQNQRSNLTGTLNGTQASVPNVFSWQNGVTLRFGAEYRVAHGSQRYPIRAGYLYDSAVTDRRYPSAFGTPPAATHTVTVGTGLQTGVFQLNLAVARRFGSTKIGEADLGTGCGFCGYAGNYSIGMTGLYLDTSVDF